MEAGDVSKSQYGFHASDDQENVNIPSTPSDQGHDETPTSTPGINHRVKNELKSHLKTLISSKPSNGSLRGKNAQQDVVAQLMADAMNSQKYLEQTQDPENPTIFNTPTSSEAREAIREKINESGDTVETDTADETSSNASTASTACEPFPDYYESCEDPNNVIDEAQEEAYKFAFSKVVEEVIRFREIDSRLTSMTPFLFSPSGVNESSPSQDNQTEVQNEGSHQSESSSATETAGSDQNNQPKLSESEIRKLDILEEIKIILSNPKLKDCLKKRFTAMANMVIRMEDALFRRQNASDPNQFLSAGVTFQVRIMAVEITEFLAVMDKRLQEQVQDAERVTYLISEIAKDRSVSVYTCYKRMSNVVMANLGKPRSLEQRLLTVFLELYDAYVYTAFLRIRNRQILIEEHVNIERLELSRLLIALWDIHNRVIENYQKYVNTMKYMKERYFAPVMDKLQKSPETWPGYQASTPTPTPTPRMAPNQHPQNSPSPQCPQYHQFLQHHQYHQPVQNFSYPQTPAYPQNLAYHQNPLYPQHHQYFFGGTGDYEMESYQRV